MVLSEAKSARGSGGATVSANGVRTARPNAPPSAPTMNVALMKARFLCKCRRPRCGLKPPKALNIPPPLRNRISNGFRASCVHARYGLHGRLRRWLVGRAVDRSRGGGAWPWGKLPNASQGANTPAVGQECQALKIKRWRRSSWLTLREQIIESGHYILACDQPIGREWPCGDRAPIRQCATALRVVNAKQEFARRTSGDPGLWVNRVTQVRRFIDVKAETADNGLPNAGHDQFAGSPDAVLSDVNRIHRGVRALGRSGRE